MKDHKCLLYNTIYIITLEGGRGGGPGGEGIQRGGLDPPPMVVSHSNASLPYPHENYALLGAPNTPQHNSPETPNPCNLGCTTRTRTASNPQTQAAAKNALFLKTCAQQGSNPLDRKCMTNENFTVPAPETLTNLGQILHFLYT